MWSYINFILKKYFMDELYINKKEVFDNKLLHFSKALDVLNFALVQAKKHEKTDNNIFEIYRDSVIQRFEYTYELSWKLMKFLWIYIEWEIEVRTPAQAMKSAFETGYIDDLEYFFDMKEFRNKTSHEYEENIANDLYYKIFKYNEYIQKFYEKIKIRYEQWYFKFN